MFLLSFNAFKHRSIFAVFLAIFLLFGAVKGTKAQDSNGSAFDGLKNLVGISASDMANYAKNGKHGEFPTTDKNQIFFLYNVKTGLHNKHEYSFLAGIFHTPAYHKVEKQMNEQAMELLKVFELDQHADTLAANLPYGEQRKLEIARAMATEPKLLLLDEPAAGMNPNETQALMDMIRFVQSHFHMTILLIEHDMRLVSGICEELTVLNFGEVLAQGKTADVLHDPQVITAYLGE